MKSAITLKIDRLAHDGRGIGHHLGKTIFVDQAVPGDEVTIVVTAQHPKFDEAKIHCMEKASSERRDPFCPYYADCGGCQLQHLQPEAQRHWKWAAFKNDLAKALTLKEAVFEAPIFAEEQHYRRRARLVFGRNKSDKLSKMGFRAQASNDIVDIDQCPMLTPALNQALAQNRPDYLAAASRAIKEVTVVEADNGIFWSDVATDPNQTKPFYRLGSLELYFPVAGFVQVNALMNQQLVAKAIDWLALEPQHKVLDAFCGVGNFTLPIAQRLTATTGKVVGVEGEADLVKMARTNAQHNDLPNADYAQADLFQTTVTELPWFRKQQYDRVLLDPGRQGALAFCKNIGLLKAQRIVYVSCNTATLIRDLKVITQQGYRVQKATLFEMFPNTSHTEAMVLLVKSAKPSAKRKIGLFKL